jgi:hypothetical protein
MYDSHWPQNYLLRLPLFVYVRGNCFFFVSVNVRETMLRIRVILCPHMHRSGVNEQVQLARATRWVCAFV